GVPRYLGEPAAVGRQGLLVAAQGAQRRRLDRGSGQLPQRLQRPRVHAGPLERGGEAVAVGGRALGAGDRPTHRQGGGVSGERGGRVARLLPELAELEAQRALLCPPQGVVEDRKSTRLN